MAAPETDEQEPSSWETLLRKMLPEGAPVPDEEHLDYSISVDYIGPPPCFRPNSNPVIPKARFTAFPKPAPSLTPNRSASVWKSRSSSDTGYSDNEKWFSATSTPLDENNSSDYIVEVAVDRGDRDEEREEMRRRICVLNVGKNGRTCSRCRKGSSGLLRGREECIVCGAVYCRKCVLKAMGSMPEGRKCVGCIGKPIDEANRGRLGSGSRLLAKVCSRLEVKRIMQAERECKANQVRPEQVSVNGRELRAEELDKLLGCAMPPKDLRPGRYWYDNDSGLWGKEGKKPDRIISSKLDVGGKLQIDASKGNTSVYMNGREITKVELRLLKLAKVQCLLGTHFWLYEDGSYEEEGQNNIKGHIWEKASVRFLSSLLSLPVPPGSYCCSKEESTVLPHHMGQDRLQKLLILGLEGTGTSTIFKQVKFLYTNNFTAEELHNMKFIIQRNIYRYLSILLEAREHFEEEALMKNESYSLSSDRPTPGSTEPDGDGQCIYSVNQKIKHFSDWLLDLVANGEINAYFPAAAREYAPLIDEIWKHPAIQETYKRREELQFLLPDVTKYFLDLVIEISSNEYEPSEKDILFAEGVTPSNGLAFLEFSFDDHSAISEIYNESPNSQTPLSSFSMYQLIQLSSKELNDGRKWLEMFEDMGAIIVCVSLCDYDQIWVHSSGLQYNKMLASRGFFESIARNSCFKGMPFLLLLNKYDLFVEKINQVPLTVCDWFSDFRPLKTHGKGIFLAQQAYHYIAAKFKQLYKSITGRKLYVCQTQAHERASVDEAFRYLREVLKWEEIEKEGEFYGLSEEDTFSSAEMSSSPCN